MTAKSGFTLQPLIGTIGSGLKWWYHKLNFDIPIFINPSLCIPIHYVVSYFICLPYFSECSSQHCLKHHNSIPSADVLISALDGMPHNIIGEIFHGKNHHFFAVPPPYNGLLAFLPTIFLMDFFVFHRVFIGQMSFWQQISGIK